MSLVETAIDEIEYPETDGRPMAETELHLHWMTRIREIMRWRYRGQRVYVGCDMYVYYVEGRIDKNVAPDDFVVLDCDPGRRRVFKTWVEERSPDVVFEITSRSTRHVDEVGKPKVFAQIGVQEYFLYDPEAEYLKPALQGFRLDDGEYARIEADADGALHSLALDIKLRLVAGELVIYDAQTGEVLLTEAEAKEQARKEESQARKKAEQARKREQQARKKAEQAQQEAESQRQAEHARAERLQAELDELRRKLNSQSSGE